MLAFSTRYWNTDSERAAAFAQRAVDLGAGGVTLDPSISAAAFKGVVDEIAAVTPILAVEAICPHPPELRKVEARPGALRLCAADRSEWEAALRWSRRSLEIAAEIRARVLVLSPGSLDLDESYADAMLVEHGPRTPSLERGVRALLERRAQLAPPAFDALRRAIDSLLPVAERLGMELAVINGAGAGALPGFQELKQLLEEFDGAPIGAWIDLAGAWRLEQLGLKSVDAWIGGFAPRLHGVHVQDAKIRDDGSFKSGLEPGAGSIDFESVARAFTREPIATVVCPASTDSGRLRNGLQPLRASGFFGPRP